jgi:chromosomal replication initiator protein
VNATGTGKVRELRDRIAQRIGDGRFRTWFGEGTVVVVEGELVTVTVPNRFVGDWIATNYMSDIEYAAQEIVGPAPQVHIRLKNDGAGVSPPGNAVDVKSADKLNGKSTVRPQASAIPARREPAARPGDRPTLRGELSNFVVGPNNELAYAAARRAVQELSEAYRPLVIHGGVGLGKTHLLQGIYNAVQREHPMLNCVYVSGEEFTNEFVHALKTQRDDAFRARFRKVDVLLVDDIHFLEGKKATQAEFLHTFNAIDATGKAIIITSDRHPRQLTTLGEPLANRLRAGTVVQVHPPELETRREILRRRAAAMRKELPPDVIDFVARNVTANVRALEGAYFRLVAVASLSGGPITLPMARQALADFLTDAENTPTVEGIEERVASVFGVTRAALHSAARDRIVSAARSIAMYLIRRHLRLSLPQIARAMGNKNHTTVLVATRRVEEQMMRDQTVPIRQGAAYVETPVRKVVAELEQDLGLRNPEN